MNVDIALFGSSDVRREILRRFFGRPGVVRHPRELARELQRSPTIVARELDRLERAGILTSERIGRARRYRVDDASPIAAEVRSLVQKTIGIEARLRDALSGLAGVRQAFVYGSYARGDDRPASDLDLFVVGEVDLEDLTERLNRAEGDLARDINVVSYAPDELDRIRAQDSFVQAVLDGPKVWLVDATESVGR